MDTILDKFTMVEMDELNQVVPSQIHIFEIEKILDQSKESIDPLSENSKDILNKFMTVPSKPATLTDAYVQRVHKDLKK